jgi:hypothetical protein
MISVASAHWTNASGSGGGALPNISVNALVIDNQLSDTVYVATDIGVFRTRDGGANWEPFNDSLPRVVVSGPRPTRKEQHALCNRSPVSKSGRRKVIPLARPPLFLFIALAMCIALSSAHAEEWVSIGPFGMEIPNHDVINGQVNAIAVDPRDANIIYVGSAEGGASKTRDGGGSWTPLTDTQLVRTLQNGSLKGTMSIGAIAVDPGKPQPVYAGTGDPNIACCFWGAALGVFRSIVGGANWIPTGADAQKAGCSNAAIGTSVVNRIVFVPGRQSSIFAATNSGVYRYRDCLDLLLWPTPPWRR